MQTTNQRKRVILLAVAFLAVGVLAGSAEAQPKKKSPQPAARAQRRDRNRGHPSVAQLQRKRPARIAQPQHKGRDKDKGGVTISFNLGGQGRTELARPRLPRHARGHYETRWAPPIYETRYDTCGRRYEVLIRDGYWGQIWVPHRCSAGCHDRRPDTGVTIRGHINF